MLTAVLILAAGIGLAEIVWHDTATALESEVLMYRLTTEIEPDDFAGFHAVIIDAANIVLHVTDSYLSPEDAADVARQWIDDNHRWPATA